MTGPQRLAKTIRVEQDAAGAPRYYIDGELFPFFTAAVQSTITVGKTEFPALILTVVAESLEVSATVNRTTDDAA